MAKILSGLSLNFPLPQAHSLDVLANEIEACMNETHSCETHGKEYAVLFKDVVALLKTKLGNLTSKDIVEKMSGVEGLSGNQLLVLIQQQQNTVSATAVAAAAAAATTTGYVTTLQTALRPLESPKGCIMDGLEYLGCEHNCMLGQRCKIDGDADTSLLAKSFNTISVDTGDERADACANCNRVVTEGDFALQHVFYKLYGVEGTKPTSIRTVPRLWCYPCANENAKARATKRLVSKKVVSVCERWNQTQQKLSQRANIASVEDGHVVI